MECKKKENIIIHYQCSCNIHCVTIISAVTFCIVNHKFPAVFSVQIEIAIRQSTFVFFRAPSFDSLLNSRRSRSAASSSKNMGTLNRKSDFVKLESEDKPISSIEKFQR